MKSGMVAVWMMRCSVTSLACEVLLLHAAQIPLWKLWNLLRLRMTRRLLLCVREGEARGRTRAVLLLRRQVLVSKFLLLL